MLVPPPLPTPPSSPPSGEEASSSSPSKKNKRRQGESPSSLPSLHEVLAPTLRRRRRVPGRFVREEAAAAMRREDFEERARRRIRADIAPPPRRRGVRPTVAGKMLEGEELAARVVVRQRIKAILRRRREARALGPWTLTELAAAMGIARGTISAILAGMDIVLSPGTRYNPAAFARALSTPSEEIDFMELFEGDDLAMSDFAAGEVAPPRKTDPRDKADPSPLGWRAERGETVVVFHREDGQVRIVDALRNGPARFTLIRKVPVGDDEILTFSDRAAAFLVAGVEP